MIIIYYVIIIIAYIYIYVIYTLIAIIIICNTFKFDEMLYWWRECIYKPLKNIVVLTSNCQNDNYSREIKLSEFCTQTLPFVYEKVFCKFNTLYFKLNELHKTTGISACIIINYRLTQFLFFVLVFHSFSKANYADIHHSNAICYFLVKQQNCAFIFWNALQPNYWKYLYM